MNRVLALAALFQAAKLADELATIGKTNSTALEACLSSILTINSTHISTIYPKISDLTLGLKTIIELFSQTNVLNSQATYSSNTARYALSLMHLERKLIKNKKMIETIQSGIYRVEQQLTHYPLLHDNIINSLANIYTDTISTFRFTIYITGEPAYLNNRVLLNKIRSLLLSGIRAAVLWRQYGGSRLQLLFSRKKIVKEAKRILEHDISKEYSK